MFLYAFPDNTYSQSNSCGYNNIVLVNNNKFYEIVDFIEGLQAVEYVLFVMFVRKSCNLQSCNTCRRQQCYVQHIMYTRILYNISCTVYTYILKRLMCRRRFVCQHRSTEAKSIGENRNTHREKTTFPLCQWWLSGGGQQKRYCRKTVSRVCHQLTVGEDEAGLCSVYVVQTQ